MKLYRLTGNSLIGQFWRLSSCIIINASSGPTWGNQIPVTEKLLQYFNASDVYLCFLLSQRAHEEITDYKHY